MRTYLQLPTMEYIFTITNHELQLRHPVFQRTGSYYRKDYKKILQHFNRDKVFGKCDRVSWIAADYHISVLRS